MWHLSSHAYSLRSLYRFRDSTVEARYRSDMNRWGIYNTQLHYCSSLVIAFFSCLSYLGSSPLPVAFWLTVLPLFVSIAFFVNGFWNPICRNHTLFLHFVYCLLATAMLFALMFLQVNEWAEYSYIGLVPEGSHVILVGPDQQTELLDNTLRQVFLRSSTQSSWILTSAMLHRPLLHLCLTGFNTWSVLGFTLMFAGMFGAEVTLQNFTSVGVENACFFTAVIVIYSVLALLLERIQRQKFLAELLLQQQMHAAETADSILNHMLKNTFADVAGNLELFLSGTATEDVLNDAMLCLRRGIRVCKERQAYLKVVAGTYTPMLHPVALSQYGLDLVAGRPVTTDLLDAVVVFDSTLLTLILENALSNAIKHGRHDDPDIKLSIRELVGEAPDLNTRRLEFAICNKVDEDREPLDSAAVFQPPLLQGSRGAKGQISNFMPQFGFKYAVCRAPMLSDGIGLAHTKLAAEAGRIAVSLTQEDCCVTFKAIVDAEIFTDGAPADLPTSGPPALFSTVPFSSHESDAAAERPHPLLPPGLHICILDDSTSSLKLVVHQIQRELPDVVLKTYGAQESDVDLFIAMAVELADVVIVDQHLEYKEQSYLGTTIVRRLQLMGYKGLICVRSADDSPEDQLQYAQSGAHCFLSKNVGGDLVHRIACAYNEFVLPANSSDPTLMQTALSE